MLICYLYAFFGKVFKSFPHFLIGLFVVLVRIFVVITVLSFFFKSLPKFTFIGFRERDGGREGGGGGEKGKKGKGGQERGEREREKQQRERET